MAVAALAALATLAAAAAGGDLQAQALAFAASSFVALAAIYPLARRRLARGSYRSGSDALNDQQATVVRRVDAVDGAVRIGGEVWSARAHDSTQAVPHHMRGLVLVAPAAGPSAITASDRALAAPVIGPTLSWLGFRAGLALHIPARAGEC